MQTEKYLRKLHNEILIILDDIVRVCDQNELKYFLIGGTLLGAVRHKGFIPWDDDLDIAMPREDFEKFVRKYYRDLKEDYYLDWFTTNKKYNHIFAKVCRRNTKFEEELGERTLSYRGIFVDIFPLDRVDGYSDKLIKRKNIVSKINNYIFSKSFDNEFFGIKKLIYKSVSCKFLYNLAYFLMTTPKFTNGKFYSNFGSQYNIKRQTHPIVNFGEGVMLPFEDREYKCPVNYEAVLTSIFGPNYMQLPPENKRKTHYPVRVVFSDGQEIVFGKTNNKLVIGKD